MADLKCRFTSAQCIITDFTKIVSLFLSQKLDSLEVTLTDSQRLPSIRVGFSSTSAYFSLRCPNHGQTPPLNVDRFVLSEVVQQCSGQAPGLVKSVILWAFCAACHLSNQYLSLFTPPQHTFTRKPSVSWWQWDQQLLEERDQRWLLSLSCVAESSGLMASR